MVSFDVKSLFTKVLILEALQVIQQRLEDDTLDERTLMSPGTVCHLISLCMIFTYFEVEDQLYEQIDNACPRYLLENAIYTVELLTYTSNRPYLVIQAPYTVLSPEY